ncbi:MAG: hypothetical protein ACFFG0_15440 [Candidatus Thorarchaeota archaeon]
MADPGVCGFGSSRKYNDRLSDYNYRYHCIDKRICRFRGCQDPRV